MLIGESKSCNEYPGGKGGAGVYQTIINQMPWHETYLEPFLGGGAIMALKRPARWNIGIDLDAEAVRQAQARIAGDDDAGSSIVGFGEEAGHIVDPGEGGFSIVGSDDSTASPALTMPQSIIESSDSGRWQFRVGDGIAFLQSYPFCGNELTYVDPPYVLSTRLSGRMYRYELTDRQHVELLDVLLTLPCRVMVSGYWTRMYAEKLQRWRSIHYEAMTRGGFTVTEWLWMNFREPSELHEYTYLGEDFRERERIKRLIVRWVTRLERMQPVQRHALQTALAQVEGQVLIAGSDDALWYRALGANFRERERVKRLIVRWVKRLGAKPLLERQAIQAALVQVQRAAGIVGSGEDAASSTLARGDLASPDVAILTG
jgi:hypothetical protein